MEQLRKYFLMAIGAAVLVYALWPPGIEFQYLGIAAGLLGIEPLTRGYRDAG